MSDILVTGGAGFIGANFVRYWRASRGGDRIDEIKARTELGYAPVRDFREGFAATLNWYLGTEEWWRAIQDGSYRRRAEAR